MGIIIFKKNLSDIAQHLYLRNDYKYHSTKDTLLKSNKVEYLKLKFVFDVINGFSASTNDYTETKTIHPFIRIGELSYKYDIDKESLIYLSDDCKIPPKVVLRKNDFVLATIGATIGKINIIDDSLIGGTASNNTTILRIKNDLIDTYNINFLEKLLQSSFIQLQFNGFKSQKSQPNLQTYDIKNINIPVIAKNKQNGIVKQIEPIESKIKELKVKIKPIPDIINVVFNREFGFDYEKLQELQNEKINVINFSFFSNNRDLRNSFKFHSKASQFAYNELKSKTCNKIKNYLACPIVLGDSISPNDYDENGDYYYLSMATVKKWEFEPDDALNVSNEYSKLHQNKTIEKNDIVATRSGVAIGKFALITEDINAIFADFTMRIRLENYNQLFAYYYFRSAFFQELIHSHKKGLQNKNIFPSQIQEFPMLDINKDRQHKIVKEIKDEIDEQNKIKLQIEKLRNQIDTIIEQAIKES